jgi:hypothetical protein
MIDPEPRGRRALRLLCMGDHPPVPCQGGVSRAQRFLLRPLIVASRSSSHLAQASPAEFPLGRAVARSLRTQCVHVQWPHWSVRTYKKPDDRALGDSHAKAKMMS